MAPSRSPAPRSPLSSRRRLLGHALAAGAVASVLPVRARAAPATTLTFAGNGGAMEAMRLIAVAYQQTNPAVQVRLLPNLGTSGGIAAAAEGAVDIALAARAPNERERAAGMRGLAYGRTPLALAVHSGVTVRGITATEVAGILSGTVAAWPDGTAIRAIRRPHNDTDTTILATLSPAVGQAMAVFQQRPGITTAGNDQDNAEALESVKGSFGAITLAQYRTERRRVSLLLLDDVPPTLAAYEAGRYPLGKTLHLVTRAEPTPAVAAFTEFVFGAVAQALLVDSGHLPLRRGGAA